MWTAIKTQGDLYRITSFLGNQVLDDTKPCPWISLFSHRSFLTLPILGQLLIFQAWVFYSLDLDIFSPDGNKGVRNED